MPTLNWIPPELALVSPYNGVRLSGESSVLTWTDIGAKWYRVHIVAPKGAKVFQRKFRDTAAMCANGLCSLDTAAVGLQLDTGVRYKWWVVAKTTGGRVRTPKWKFKLGSATPTPAVMELPLLESNTFDDPNVLISWADEQTPFGTSPKGSRALQLSTQTSYSLPYSYINDVSMEGRVAIVSGAVSFSVRNSAAGGYTAVLESTGLLTLYRDQTVLGTANVNLSAGQSHLFRLSAIGDRVAVSIDGIEVLSAVDSMPLPYGVLFVGSAGATPTNATLDDLSLWGAQSQEPLQGIDLIEPMLARMSYASLMPDVTESGVAGSEGRVYYERSVCNTICTVNIYSTDPAIETVNDDKLLEIPKAFQPQLSLDGEKLSFISSMSGANRVWVKYLREGTIERITPNSITQGAVTSTDPDRFSSWSSQSDALAFVRNANGALGDTQINIINIYTRQLWQKDTNAGYALRGLAWKPNSRIVVFKDGVYLKYVDFDSSQPAQHLTYGNPVKNLEGSAPAWSPDGSKLAYYHDSNNNLPQGLYIYTSANNTPQRISTDIVYSITWSPDTQQRLAVLYPIIDPGHPTTYEIKVIDSSGGFIRKIATNVRFASDSAFTPSTISWGSRLFPKTIEKCVSILVPNAVRRWNTLPAGTGTPVATPTYFPTGSRLHAIGRVVQLNGEWLMINGIINNYTANKTPVFFSTGTPTYAYIRKDSFLHTPVGTPDPGVTPQATIVDACDDDLNNPALGYADDAYQLPLYVFTPTPTPTATQVPTCVVRVNIDSTPPATPVPANVRDYPWANGSTIVGQVFHDQSVSVSKRAINAANEVWYYIQTPELTGWIIGYSLSSNDLAQGTCPFLPPYGASLTPLPTQTATLYASVTYTSTPYPTKGASPTPTATPTEVPRFVLTQAVDLHNNDDRYGLPVPFKIWPVTTLEGDQRGFGPNKPAYDNCYLTPTPTPPAGATPDPAKDGCQYRGTHRIHPGIDFFNEENPSSVVAVCDGVIIHGIPGNNGGSAQPNAGAGLSLRCFANDPRDTDNDGQRNMSNIIVVYNHLTNLQVQPNSYRLVRRGDILADTTDYTTTAGIYVPAHLDLQIFMAKDFRYGEGLLLNPLMMFDQKFGTATPAPDVNFSFSAYPEGYTIWSLQGNLSQRASSGNVDFWKNQESPVFIEDINTYLATPYPDLRYSGPNCIGLPSNTNDFGLTGTHPYQTCVPNDIDSGPTPAP